MEEQLKELHADVLKLKKNVRFLIDITLAAFGFLLAKWIPEIEFIHNLQQESSLLFYPIYISVMVGLYILVRKFVKPYEIDLG